MKEINSSEYLAVFDKKDYDNNWPRIRRVAARAIICIDGKFVFIQSRKYGEYKFPGGGQEQGEDILTTLIREVREETGLTVIPESIRLYGKTIEMNHDNYDGESEAIFEMLSYYYTCSVIDNGGRISLTDSEIRLGYTMRQTTLSEAIANNMEIKDDINVPWLRRDTTVMELLHKYTRKL